MNLRACNIAASCVHSTQKRSERIGAALKLATADNRVWSSIKAASCRFSCPNRAPAAAAPAPVTAATALLVPLQPLLLPPQPLLLQLQPFWCSYSPCCCFYSPCCCRYSPCCCRSSPCYCSYSPAGAATALAAAATALAAAATALAAAATALAAAATAPAAAAPAPVTAATALLVQLQPLLLLLQPLLLMPQPLLLPLQPLLLPPQPLLLQLQPCCCSYSPCCCCYSPAGAATTLAAAATALAAAATALAAAATALAAAATAIAAATTALAATTTALADAAQRAAATAACAAAATTVTCSTTDRHCLSWPLSQQLQQLGVDSGSHCLSRTTPPLSSFASGFFSEPVQVVGALRCVTSSVKAAALGASESAAALGASESAAALGARASPVTDSPLAPPPRSPLSLPRLRGMHSRLHVSGLPRSLPSLPRSPALSCLPCVEGRQRAAPHSSEFPLTTAPLQTLQIDVWGPTPVDGTDQERYFLLVVDDYTRYTTVFPLRCKAVVSGVLIPWILATRRQLCERFSQDFPVLRLHSDRGGEFSSDLLTEFFRDEGIVQSFTLPASPLQNGTAEHHIGLIMEVARSSMVHAAAPHFLWPFAARYAAHQINLWPRVSEPETSPALRWTGKVGDASVFRVWGALSLVHDAKANKLSSCTLRCVFLGFPTVASPWQFYHPRSRRVFSSQDVTFDESVCYYRLHPHVSHPGPAPSGVSQVDLPPLVEPLKVSSDSYGPAEGGDPAADDTTATRRSPRLETPPGFPPRPSSPPPQSAPVDSGAETAGAESGGAESGDAEPEGEGSGGAGSGGATTGGAGSWGAATGGADSGSPASPSGGGAVGDPAGGPGAGQPPQPDLLETLLPQAIRAWIVRRGSPGGGGYGPAGAGAASPGGTAGAGGTGGTAGAGGAASAGGTRGAVGAGGAGATSPRGATGAAGAGPTSLGGTTSAGGAGGNAGARGAGAGGTGGASAAGPGGARSRGAGAAGAGGAVRAGGPNGAAGSGGSGGAAGAGAAGAGGTAGARGAGGATRAIGTGGVGGTTGARGPRAAGASGAAGAGGAGGAAGAARSGGAGAAGAGGAGAAATALRRPFFYPQLQSSLPPPESILRQFLSLPSSTDLPLPLLCTPADQSQPQLLPGSPVPAPGPHTEVTESLTKRREPQTRASTPDRARRVARPRPPAVPGTHGMALCPSSIPQRVVLPEPPASSLPLLH
ncbi:unnamed protein product [Closterium sp. NIES-53]